MIKSPIRPPTLREYLHPRIVERWARVARGAPDQPLAKLRDHAARAAELAPHLEAVLRTAEARGTEPAEGPHAGPGQGGADWTWRPDPWRAPLPRPAAVGAPTGTRLHPGLALFHDCPLGEVTLRQRRAAGDPHDAPYGVTLDVLRFAGGFLSLAIDLPEAAVQGLRRRHLIRMDARIDRERPSEVFARLNLAHGPNVERIVREVPPADGHTWVEFDLATTTLNEKRAERLWVDLIFEAPAMTEIALRDVIFARRPRADL
ncbi:MAG: DUF6478 family protein [Shimia sp.]